MAKHKPIFLNADQAASLLNNSGAVRDTTFNRATVRELAKERKITMAEARKIVDGWKNNA